VYSLFPDVVGVLVLILKYKHIALIVTALSLNKYCILGWEVLQNVRIYRLFRKNVASIFMVRKQASSKYL
jgi:hypothetical protein